MLDKKLLALLACPLCKGPLIHQQDELICRADALAFPVRDGIPVMLEGEARALTLEESLPEHGAR
ncbi:Trm112 family protein [Paraperlucidibaca wandonensis]|jgi:uncharacterized protein YbaR (Trm112 family)|uniref:UPF0434 protein ACFQ0F_06215 n=1 Tax=Paraperlucidibaca wandonensis TaxID=1268273 RepID=A0ABW3HFJ2_9GAMM|nr:Trm112 family protein [Paraperlucidibaca sp.]MBQ0722198.1 Trm112 family protein [Paraperlucidibaca sp.]MBQ0842003.1 Trm112 family protein [Paraperlucidibaca sp.]|tara:strand:+ start:4033 stop:4227 length:195 start_codon:yes stop_codon:yes gene_type:complete